MDNSRKGIHVGSGYFRIDRKKALETLRDFQVPEVGMFLDLWIRCAVASQAKELRIESMDGGLSLAFDGRPFARAELEDPYSCLFAEEHVRNARAREFAQGLLAVLRLKPERVMLDSGGLRLTVHELGRENLEELAAVEPGTSIHTQWGRRFGSVEPLYVARLHVSRLLDMVPIKVLCPQYPVGSAPVEGLAFSRGHVRGWLRARHEHASPNSRLRIYRHGVLADQISCDMPLRVTAMVNDDRARLNASLTGVVHDERLDTLKRLVAARARELLARALESHASNFPATARLFSQPALQNYWRERSAWEVRIDESGANWDLVKGSLRAAVRRFAQGELVSDQDIRQVSSAAWVLDWLHDAAARLLSDPETDEADPVLRALWRAPLFLRSDYGVLSLLELEQRRRELGGVPYTRRPSTGSSPIVWCPSPKDMAVLKKRFGEAVREEG